MKKPNQILIDKEIKGFQQMFIGFSGLYFSNKFSNKWDYTNYCVSRCNTIVT